MADTSEKLLELLQSDDCPLILCYGGMERLVNYLIANGVTVPVRCKDCKSAIVNENHPNRPLICCLTRMCGTVDPNWFCWQGERRTDESQL